MGPWKKHQERFMGVMQDCPKEQKGLHFLFCFICTLLVKTSPVHIKFPKVKCVIENNTDPVLEGLKPLNL